METKLRVEILPQPDDFTCGPTCLHALYRYFGDELPLERVISEVQVLDNRGTLDVLLANHALARGYSARIFTYNVQMFDPTWFDGRPSIFPSGCDCSSSTRFRPPDGATEAYLLFLAKGASYGSKS